MSYIALQPAHAQSTSSDESKLKALYNYDSDHGDNKIIIKNLSSDAIWIRECNGTTYSTHYDKLGSNKEIVIKQPTEQQDKFYYVYTSKGNFNDDSCTKTSKATQYIEINYEDNYCSYSDASLSCKYKKDSDGDYKAFMQVLNDDTHKVCMTYDIASESHGVSKNKTHDFSKSEDFNKDNNVLSSQPIKLRVYNQKCDERIKPSTKLVEKTIYLNPTNIKYMG